MLRIVVLLDRHPVLSETFVRAELAALRTAGVQARVEAGAREREAPVQDVEGLEVAYLERDAGAVRARALLWLAARHPLRCLRDLRARRRWAREEPVRPLRELAPAALRLARGGERHVHAHFAAGAALDALRLARLLGVTCSVTAHAYDIWAQPRNLREKLESAAFATTGCAYNVAHLRELAPGAGVHEIVMGIDPQAWRRTRPHGDERVVLAVGRLVAKKGFADLVEAAALLPERTRVRIVGEGPERAALERRIAELHAPVELLGALPPDGVREELERAAVLAMPCVVARDGDRDSMPVVVKEALAMEVPVAATDEAGLPEIVRPPWGRLARPRDPRSLAAAIAELLALPPAERAAAGAAGRAHVVEHASLVRETAKLAALIDQAVAPRR
ncbi:MAG TPA: glycosyltransferase [Solirubrobacteraceae bacterium]|nr:glycosyltransferase [Solirubrobacteraceae bacterium]